jgi:deoxyribonuclease V
MQKRLSQKLIFEDTLPDKINYVAGVDISYYNGKSIGAVSVLDYKSLHLVETKIANVKTVSVLDYKSLHLVETKIANVKTCIPYVPTLLSFREVPPAYSAVKKLEIKPDVFMVDGQGFAHPYGLGFASHLGLMLDRPTLGIAKSRLYGKVEAIGKHRQVELLKEKGKVVGAEVITRQETKPIYVSVGHKVSLERAVRLVLDCTMKYRLPEPIRSAHKFATNEKKKLKASF